MHIHTLKYNQHTLEAGGGSTGPEQQNPLETLYKQFETKSKQLNLEAVQAESKTLAEAAKVQEQQVETENAKEASAQQKRMVEEVEKAESQATQEKEEGVKHIETCETTLKETQSQMEQDQKALATAEQQLQAATEKVQGTTQELQGAKSEVQRLTGTLSAARISVQRNQALQQGAKTPEEKERLAAFGTRLQGRVRNIEQLLVSQKAKVAALEARLQQEKQTESNAKVEAQKCKEALKRSTDLHREAGDNLSAAKIKLSELEAALKVISERKKIVLDESLAEEKRVEEALKLLDAARESHKRVEVLSNQAKVAKHISTVKVQEAKQYVTLYNKTVDELYKNTSGTPEEKLKSVFAGVRAQSEQLAQQATSTVLSSLPEAAKQEVKATQEFYNQQILQNQAILYNQLRRTGELGQSKERVFTYKGQQVIVNPYMPVAPDGSMSLQVVKEENGIVTYQQEHLYASKGDVEQVIHGGNDQKQRRAYLEEMIKDQVSSSYGSTASEYKLLMDKFANPFLTPKEKVDELFAKEFATGPDGKMSYSGKGPLSQYLGKLQQRKAYERAMEKQLDLAKAQLKKTGDNQYLAQIRAIEMVQKGGDPRIIGPLMERMQQGELSYSDAVQKLEQGIRTRQNNRQEQWGSELEIDQLLDTRFLEKQDGYQDAFKRMELSFDYMHRAAEERYVNHEKQERNHSVTAWLGHKVLGMPEDWLANIEDQSGVVQAAAQLPYWVENTTKGLATIGWEVLKLPGQAVLGADTFRQSMLYSVGGALSGNTEWSEKGKELRSTAFTALKENMATTLVKDLFVYTGQHVAADVALAYEGHLFDAENYDGEYKEYVDNAMSMGANTSIYQMVEQSINKAQHGSTFDRVGLVMDVFVDPIAAVGAVSKAAKFAKVMQLEGKAARLVNAMEKAERLDPKQLAQLDSLLHQAALARDAFARSALERSYKIAERSQTGGVMTKAGLALESAAVLPGGMLRGMHLDTLMAGVHAAPLRWSERLQLNMSQRADNAVQALQKVRQETQGKFLKGLDEAVSTKQVYQFAKDVHQGLEKNIKYFDAQAKAVTKRIDELLKQSEFIPDNLKEQWATHWEKSQDLPKHYIAEAEQSISQLGQLRKAIVNQGIQTGDPLLRKIDETIALYTSKLEDMKVQVSAMQAQADELFAAAPKQEIVPGTILEGFTLPGNKHVEGGKVLGVADGQVTVQVAYEGGTYQVVVPIEDVIVREVQPTIQSLPPLPEAELGALGQTADTFQANLSLNNLVENMGKWDAHDVSQALNATTSPESFGDAMKFMVEEKLPAGAELVYFTNHRPPVEMVFRTLDDGTPQLILMQEGNVRAVIDNVFQGGNPMSGEMAAIFQDVPPNQGVLKYVPADGQNPLREHYTPEKLQELKKQSNINERIGDALYTREQPWSDGTAQYDQLFEGAQGQVDQFINGLLEQVPDTFKNEYKEGFLDSHTGLHNRSVFEVAADMFSGKKDILCASFDADLFSVFNALKGTRYGDYLIREMGMEFHKMRQILQQHSPDARVAIGRMGGEEFVVLAEGVPLMTLQQTMDSMRAVLQKKLRSTLGPDELQAFLDIAEANGKISAGERAIAEQTIGGSSMAIGVMKAGEAGFKPGKHMLELLYKRTDDGLVALKNAGQKNTVHTLEEAFSVGDIQGYRPQLKDISRADADRMFQGAEEAGKHLRDIHEAQITTLLQEPGVRTMMSELAPIVGSAERVRDLMKWYLTDTRMQPFGDFVRESWSGGRWPDVDYALIKNIVEKPEYASALLDVRRSYLQYRVEHNIAMGGLTETGFIKKLKSLDEESIPHHTATLELQAFKSINESFGHPGGDYYIRTAVQGVEDFGKIHNLEVALYSRGDTMKIVMNRVDGTAIPEAEAAKLLQQLGAHVEIRLRQQFFGKIGEGAFGASAVREVPMSWMQRTGRGAEDMLVATVKVSDGLPGTTNFRKVYGAEPAMGESLAAHPVIKSLEAALADMQKPISERLTLNAVVHPGTALRQKLHIAPESPVRVVSEAQFEPVMIQFETTEGVEVQRALPRNDLADAVLAQDQGVQKLEKQLTETGKGVKAVEPEIESVADSIIDTGATVAEGIVALLPGGSEVAELANLAATTFGERFRNPLQDALQGVVNKMEGGRQRVYGFIDNYRSKVSSRGDVVPQAPLNTESVLQRLNQGDVSMVNQFPGGVEAFQRATGLSVSPDGLLRQTRFIAPDQVPRVKNVGAIGDLHGNLDALKGNLNALGYAKWGKNGFEWTGGNNVAVFMGDILADRVQSGLDILDNLQQLKKQAQAAGGDVLILAGNHEDFMLMYLMQMQGSSHGGGSGLALSMINDQGQGILELSEFLPGSKKGSQDYLDLGGQHDVILNNMRSNPRGQRILEGIAGMKILEQIDDKLYTHTPLTERMYELIDRYGNGNVQKGIDRINAAYQQVLYNELVLGKKVNRNSQGWAEFTEIREVFLDTANRNSSSDTLTSPIRGGQSVEKLINSGINQHVHGHESSTTGIISGQSGRSLRTTSIDTSYGKPGAKNKAPAVAQSRRNDISIEAPTALVN